MSVWVIDVRCYIVYYILYYYILYIYIYIYYYYILYHTLLLLHLILYYTLLFFCSIFSSLPSPSFSSSLPFLSFQYSSSHLPPPPFCSSLPIFSSSPIILGILVGTYICLLIFLPAFQTIRPRMFYRMGMSSGAV